MDNNKQKRLDILVNEYLIAFLAFAIRKTSNPNEAEEVAQEIAYQCVLAINKDRNIENFAAFLWSIAHNTYKRWCGRKQNISIEDVYDTFSNIVSDDSSFDEPLIKFSESDSVHRELSRMSNLYRKTLVCFYYDEFNISEIANKLKISIEMVKFYLSKGRQKLKEAYTMNNIGEKSFNPSEFSVYKSAIDFSKVNVWEVFKRKLPCQIVLICHDKAKTISEISIETGTPAVYIEDEVDLLIGAGVMVNPVKGKYRTNLFILKKNSAAKIKDQFNKLHDAYAPAVISVFDKNLSKLKECNVFSYNASINRYAWFYMDGVLDFDYSGYELSNSDYPSILSCGSKAFIFAEEAKGSPWGAGQTPTYLEKCVVLPRDVGIFGEYHRQKELHDERKAKALYNVYKNETRDEDIEIYAQLIEEGYVIKQDTKLICDVPVSTVKCRNLFEEINVELIQTLKPLCKEIRENIGRIVTSTIPEQLREYAKGYTETWISFYSGVYLHEALYNKGFITLPEDGDNMPLACYIYEKQD